MDDAHLLFGEPHRLAVTRVRVGDCDVAPLVGLELRSNIDE
jgi:hypothetical protein